MRQDTEKNLKEVLNKYFFGQGQRLDMMSKVVLSVFQLCTINFSKLSLALNPKVLTSSNFKRLQRFFKEYRFCRRAYVQFAWARFGDKGQWVALSIDRTNWKFGKVNINILLVGISWRGTCIPLVWKMLDKRGNSNEEERIDLLNDLLSLLEQNQINSIRKILMDREFCGNRWLRYLLEKDISFVLRIRKNTLIQKNRASKTVPVSRLFSSPNFKILRKKRKLFGLDLYIAGQRLKNGDYLILISDKSLKDSREMYGERWGIEVFFGCLKTRGFNFEDTHLIHLDRIETVIYVLAIAFIWAFSTGEVLVEKGIKIIPKTIKGRKTKLMSIFRIGLDNLRLKIIHNLSIIWEIQVLSCT